MKKISILMVVLVLVSMASYAAVFEIENETYKFIVTMINQEPDPVAPGNTFDVRFRIENRMLESARNVEVKIEPKYPFSLYWSQDRIKEIGTLAPNQIDDNGVKVKFKLLVDKNAAEGENVLEFWYRIDGGAWRKAGDYDIEIRERDAVLAINEIKSGSEKMSPGDKVTVSFNLENMATSVLKDIRLKLDIYSSITSAGTVTMTELPFTPIGSSNEKTVDKILAGKSKEVSFDLFIDADAESKVYKVPYTLTYSDEVGTNFSRTGYVGLMVDAEPDISINMEDTDIYAAGSKGEFEIKFVNKGFSDIKFLNVVLKETQEFSLLSNHEVYIGNIDSDDYETADYKLLVNKEVKGDVTLPLRVEYRDANGKLHSKDLNLKLELFSGDALKQRVGQGGNSAVGIIVILVIVGGGIWFYRRRKRKKLQQKK